MSAADLLTLSIVGALVMGAAFLLVRIARRDIHDARTARLVVQAGGPSYRFGRRRWIALLAVLALLGLWVNGSFDRMLAPLHLNYHDCARNGFGATFCGNELEQYEQRIGH